MARLVVRDCLTIAFILLTTPLWAPVVIAGAGGQEVGIFATLGQTLSLIPGVIGVFSRRAYYVMTLEACARDVGVGFGTWFSKRRVRIAQHVSFGAHCTIGSCTIGEGTLCGSNVDFLSGRRQHGADGTDVLRSAEINEFTQIQIGRNVWIGNRSIIMADIGDNSVIGAGSVIVHPIPQDSVAVGNPAVVKKNYYRPSEHCSLRSDEQRLPANSESIVTD